MLYKNYEKKFAKKTSVTKKTVTDYINANKATYREVSDAVRTYFADVTYSKSFIVTKRIGIINYSYTINYLNNAYTLRQNETLLADVNTVSEVLTALFTEIRGF